MSLSLSNDDHLSIWISSYFIFSLQSVTKSVYITEVKNCLNGSVKLIPSFEKIVLPQSNWSIRLLFCYL